MTSKDPLNLAIVSGIVSAFPERQEPLPRAQEAIDSTDKYMLPFSTGNNDLSPIPLSTSSSPISFEEKK